MTKIPGSIKLILPQYKITENKKFNEGNDYPSNDLETDQSKSQAHRFPWKNSSNFGENK